MKTATSAAQRLEFRRKELAAFLRARREAIQPEELGLNAYGRRRTPGLRREEVAMLAQIGAGWYTKLETARDVKVSPNTLMSITQVLRFTRSETEYAFALADVAMPVAGLFVGDDGIPPALDQLIPNMGKVSAVLWDRYMTAVRWNAIGDAMFDIAQYRDPIDRNAIVRLHRDPTNASYYSPDYEELLRNLVGIFRRAYVNDEPSELARQVYEIASNYEAFRKNWKERPVDEVLFPERAHPFERHHSKVGTYSMVATNLQIVTRPDLYLRVWAPTDDASAEKFAELERLGTAWSPGLTA